MRAWPIKGGLNAEDGTIVRLFGGAVVGSLAAALLLEPAQAWFGIGTITLGALALNAAFLGAWASSTTLTVGNPRAHGLAGNELPSFPQRHRGPPEPTPASLQGRVNTTARMIALGRRQPFGAGIGGLCAELWGVPAALLIAGAACYTVRPQACCPACHEPGN